MNPGACALDRTNRAAEAARALNPMEPLMRFDPIRKSGHPDLRGECQAFVLWSIVPPITTDPCPPIHVLRSLPLTLLRALNRKGQNGTTQR
jgi:hypothetical protein